MNHPFVDGNKRVAFFGTDTFLRLNGWKLQVDGDEAHAHLMGLLERNEADFERLEAWIRRSIRWLR
jgi:death-on-curing protein